MKLRAVMFNHNSERIAESCHMTLHSVAEFVNYLHAEETWIWYRGQNGPCPDAIIDADGRGHITVERYHKPWMH